MFKSTLGAAQNRRLEPLTIPLKSASNLAKLLTLLQGMLVLTPGYLDF
jgi:hypothetical protein